MTAELGNRNLEALALAAEKLAPLLEQIVFIGGCVTGLLITDPAAAPVRATLDVDAIVEVASYPAFAALEQQLRDIGFHETNVPGAPICRWSSGDLLLDLMPTDPSILRFGNRWYRPAFLHAQAIDLDSRKVRVIAAPYFLATKLDAFYGRGKNDYRGSPDLEDIVTVVDGRVEIVGEVQSSGAELRGFLGVEFSALLADPNFMEALPGHLLPDMISQQRAGIVLERMRQIARGV